MPDTSLDSPRRVLLPKKFHRLASFAIPGFASATDRPGLIPRCTTQSTAVETTLVLILQIVHRAPFLWSFKTKGLLCVTTTTNTDDSSPTVQLAVETDPGITTIASRAKARVIADYHGPLAASILTVRTVTGDGVVVLLPDGAPMNPMPAFPTVYTAQHLISS